MPFEISPKIIEAPAPVRRKLLSDVIRDGAAKYPEGYWYIDPDQGESCCAIGAAARSLGWEEGSPIDYLSRLGYDPTEMLNVSGEHGTRFRKRKIGRSEEQGDIRLSIADQLAARGL